MTVILNYSWYSQCIYTTFIMRFQSALTPPKRRAAAKAPIPTVARLLAAALEVAAGPVAAEAVEPDAVLLGAEEVVSLLMMLFRAFALKAS